MVETADERQETIAAFGRNPLIFHPATERRPAQSLPSGFQMALDLPFQQHFFPL
jgi:hypothetical protein